MITLLYLLENESSLFILLPYDAFGVLLSSNLILPAQDALRVVPTQAIEVVVLTSIHLAWKQIIPVPAYQFDCPFMPIDVNNASIRILLYRLLYPFMNIDIFTPFDWKTFSTFIVFSFGMFKDKHNYFRFSEFLR